MKISSIDKGRGRMALIVGHCAGMVDLIGLPLWVGVLIETYQFDPQQAGGLATLFLAGIVVASVLLAPRFHRVSKRLVATSGFSVAAVGFFIASTTRDPIMLIALHAVCGIATGAGLSVTHGTMSQGEQPHRLMAIAGVAMGVFAVIFMAFVPRLLIDHGGPTLFVVFGAVMAFAALIMLSAFPTQAQNADTSELHLDQLGSMPRAVWFGLAGFTLVCLAHAMSNSFLERVGVDSGFPRGHIANALLAMAIVSVLPGLLAAYLEHRVKARTVLFATPILHAIMVAVLMTSTSFPVYVIAMISLPGLMIFMNTFAFGAIADLDRSGRALAAFPASIMVGTAAGPLVGGTLVKSVGYPAVGVGALCICVFVVMCFMRLTKQSKPADSVNESLQASSLQ